MYDIIILIFPLEINSTFVEKSFAIRVVSRKYFQPYKKILFHSFFFMNWEAIYTTMVCKRHYFLPLFVHITVSAPVWNYLPHTYYLPLTLNRKIPFEYSISISRSHCYKFWNFIIINTNQMNIHSNNRDKVIKLKPIYK